MKITGYGPWTLTLGSDREHELQMLQASLYQKLQKLFSEKNGLVFQNRSDEFFAVTNGISLDEHIDIQKELEKLFEIRISMTVGYGTTPFDANVLAYNGKKDEKFLNKQYNIYGSFNGKEENLSSEHHVAIMHIDVDSLTVKRKTLSPYETSSLMFKLYSKMSDFFLEKKSLAFFMGGDNFMVISNSDHKINAQEFIDKIKTEMNLLLNCGIGISNSGRGAAKRATKSLDTIREIRDSGKEKPEVYELK
jgi:GTP cyclohydrolase IIa